MEGEPQERPRVRRQGLSKNSFVVEGNINAIQWPQECAVCGGPAEVTDSLNLEHTFKGLGKIHVEVPRIPYCQSCFPKIRKGKVLDRMTYTLTLVLGIPIGLLLTLMAARQSGATFVWCGLLLLIGIAIGYGLAWLIVKLPVKILFRRRFAEPVDAWLLGVNKSDGREGVSVVIAIPNKEYAAKFAQLNGV